MLRLADHWVWDFWTATEGDRHHVFFLRASRALHDPDRRHQRASIGHAVSTDLRSWQLLPDALVHADVPAWDDRAVWTGSVVAGPDGRWRLFYTGISHTGAHLGQRIGVALSEDLVTWHRSGREPLLNADARWYDSHPDGSSDAWRDPFVFADPAGAGWHMLITARARTGPPGGRGVIGYAYSADLVHWEVRPPLTAPAGFHHLEVPQTQIVDGQPVLIFSCQPDRVPPGLAAVGCWTVPGDSLLGPWDLAAVTPFAHDSLYCARLVPAGNGQWSMLGFRNPATDAFPGEIIDPIPVTWANGRLTAMGGAADS